MSRPGPSPKPTKLKKMQGNPGGRPLPKNEPQPSIASSVPPAPEYLDEVGQAEWNRMGVELHKLGLLTTIDLSAFAAYCQQYSIWISAIEEVKKGGVVVVAQSGYQQQSPYFTIQNKAQTEMRKWLTEFGMTPSSRSRVQVSEQTEIDPMEEFLKGSVLKVVE